MIASEGAVLGFTTGPAAMRNRGDERPRRSRSPRDFALLLDVMGGLALERVDKIALARSEGVRDTRPAG